MKATTIYPVPNYALAAHTSKQPYEHTSGVTWYDRRTDGGEEEDNYYLKPTPKYDPQDGFRAVSLFTSLIPGVSTGKDAQEFVMGKDLITGEKVSKVDKTLIVVGAFAPAVSGKVLIKGKELIGEGIEAVVRHGDDGGKVSTTIISSEMEKKILEGQRIQNSNKMIGGHSPNAVDNKKTNYAVEAIKQNSDGTKVVKYVTQFSDGGLSKMKTSTLFPDGWTDNNIIDAIKNVGDKPVIGIRTLDGLTLHRGIVKGIEIDVIKMGDDVVSGYPVGGKPTPGFDSTR